MKDNKFIKEMLDTMYKDTSVWEKAWQEADYTKVETHLPDGEIEYVDFTGDPIVEEWKNQGNYRYFFEQLKIGLEREPTVFDYYDLYIKLLNDLAGFFEDNMSSIIEEGVKDFTFYDVVDAHAKEQLKLELVFNEYTENLDTPVDMAIKEFPKNTTEKEKAILDHLARKFHIKRRLTDNGLLPLFGKNGTKELLREFYKYAPEYKDYEAFNFIISSIETNLPVATLQNYCREVRKDVKR